MESWHSVEMQPALVHPLLLRHARGEVFNTHIILNLAAVKGSLCLYLVKGARTKWVERNKAMMRLF